MIMIIIIIMETMITVNDNNVDEDDRGDDFSEFIPVWYFRNLDACSVGSMTACRMKEI